MNKSVLICFFGMDGSGKSTLSSLLADELKKQRYSVYCHWWLEAETSIIRKIIKKIYKLSFFKSKQSISIQKETSSSGKNGFFSWIYPRIVLLDYFIFGFFHATLPKKIGKKKVIIFDRFYPDTICSLRREFGLEINHNLLIGLIKILIPSPDLIFFINISPEVALERKKEELLNIDNAQKIWEEHNKTKMFMVATMKNANIVQIDNSLSLEIIKEQIINVTLKDLINFYSN